jgi:hypothetical protein
MTAFYVMGYIIVLPICGKITVDYSIVNIELKITTAPIAS